MPTDTTNADLRWLAGMMLMNRIANEAIVLAMVDIKGGREVNLISIRNELQAKFPPESGRLIPASAVEEGINDALESLARL